MENRTLITVDMRIELLLALESRKKELEDIIKNLEDSERAVFARKMYETSLQAIDQATEAIASATWII